MSGGISRKDFLNGIALVGGLGLSGVSRVMAQTAEGSPDTSVLPPLQAQNILESDPRYYPPALTGMRGSHAGSYPAGHALRDSEAWVQQSAIDSGESYDLVIVGAGISGLSAAHYYRKARPDAKILILENHDDFGGHAKRNEFTSKSGRMLIGFGGTQAMEGVSEWGEIPRAMMKDLGVEPQRFHDFYDMNFFDRNGLANAVFFDRETFGRDVHVQNHASSPAHFTARFLNADLEAYAAFLDKAPIAPKARQDLLALQKEWPDPLPGLDAKQKTDRLRSIPFATLLLETLKVHPDAVKLLQQMTHGGFGHGIDAVDALIGAGMTAPGLLKGMGLPDWSALFNDPYVYHFPDGNASIARLLVRGLVPGCAPGHTMEDIVLARFNYAALDRVEQPVRIRLNSTVVRAKNADDGVDVHYMRAGKTYRVRSKQAIMACWHMMLPYLMPELPEPQKEAMHANVKVPLIYGNVQLSNWRAFKTLGMGYSYCPGSYFSEVTMDFPVTMGGYDFTASPDDPCVLHLVRTPCAPGLPPRDQHRAGRADIYATSFATFEEQVRDQLTRMYGAGGFDADRDIEAITINRWPHGYCYYASRLWDGDVKPEARFNVLARQRFGNISMANADAGGIAETHIAIEQAHRAVAELLA